MAYYIRQIPNNTYNKYKYSYLDHLQLVIDIKDNYWYFYTELFCINNSSLPLNALTMDMQLPYQQVSNIQFNLAVDQKEAKTQIKANAEFAKLYESNFFIDVSQNQYLKQNLNNNKLNIRLNLEIEPQVIAKASFSPSQEDLDGLINETGQQRFDFSLYYSNTYEINKSGNILNNYSYRLSPFEYECNCESSSVNVETNDYSHNYRIINSLAKIESSDYFQILSGKITFNYWLNSSIEQKVFEQMLDVPKNNTKQMEIFFDKYTTYDFINNKIVIDSKGIKGIYIPFLSHGYYQLILKVKQKDNINTFIITNNYEFCIDSGKPYIGCKPIIINDLKNFKEIRF